MKNAEKKSRVKTKKRGNAHIRFTTREKGTRAVSLQTPPETCRGANTKDRGKFGLSHRKPLKKKRRVGSRVEGQKGRSTGTPMKISHPPANNKGLKEDQLVVGDETEKRGKFTKEV